MLKVNYRKRIYEYKEKEMPKFKNKRQEYFWLQRQKRKIMLYNIKNVNVQIKDVKKFCFSDNPALIALYSQVVPFCLSDDEYITISRYKKGNDLIVYGLITSDWILNKSDLESKSIEDLKEKVEEIRKTIEIILENPNVKKDISLKNRIILLEYQENELLNYLTYIEEKEVLQKKIGSKKNN